MDSRVRKSLWKRSVGLVLAASLLLTNPVYGAGQKEAGSWYEPVYHANIPYSDMKYEGFDRTELDSLLEELERLCSLGEAGAEEEVVRVYEEILSQWGWLDTQAALSMLEYYKNVADEEAQKVDLEMTNLQRELKDKIFLTLKKASESSYGEVLKKQIGEYGVERLEDYQPKSDREAELWQQDDRLIQSYDQVMLRNYTVQVDGEEWTMEQYQKNPPEDEEKVFQIDREFNKAKNKDAAAILQEMVQVRNEIAELNGYDDFAAYTYEEIYERDYTPEDVRSIRETVKESMIPLYEDFGTAFDMTNVKALGEAADGKNGEEILDDLEPIIHQIHPELSEAFSHMREYGLYDIEKSDTKLEMAFCIGIPSYGAAFFFDQPYGSYLDYGTVLHEFGHYNEIFHGTQPRLWQSDRMDVFEIHSQGLEILAYPYAEELFGEGGEAFQYDRVDGLLWVIREGCLYDEFQNSIYKNPGMTTEEMNKEFFRISKEYGYDYQEDQDQAYSWVNVPQTFQQPMYYISYATSALAAMDIWMESLENREEAVDKYMHLTALGGSYPFRQVTKDVGLRDVFREDVVRDIAEEIREIMEVDEKIAEYEKNQKQEEARRILVGILGVAAAGLLVVVVVRKKKRRSLAENLEE